ncbi:putative Ig domain-containing protein [Ectothiorhodospira mobilis]|uniref:putative Ig domain-containing protein n=1 Tax=Ectothiorhodospira mobilis TaxID=195064 RepID=UPI00190844A7|nr:putative Ig domain-containing protein [Ectothiorhodospira mobilis]MBK1692758.1 hypothetical protein [Ectothiorhodospira mobilis]
MLTACGGGDSDTWYQDQAYGIAFETTRDTLAANPLDLQPCLRLDCYHTVQVNVRVTDDSGHAAPTGTPVTLTVRDVSRGYITTLDDPETEDINEFLQAMGSTVEETGGDGVATFFFTSSENPGDVILSASVTPESGGTVSGNQTLTVGSMQGTGRPAQNLLYWYEDYLFPAGFGAPSTSQATLVLLDEALGSVQDPAEGVNNIRAEIFTGTDSGEYLVATAADGSSQQTGPDKPYITTTSEDGRARISLKAGNTTGFIGIRVTTDRADNNVDNGIDQPVEDAASIAVVTSVTGSPLNILTEETLPEGTMDDSYAVLLEASGGTVPYTWRRTQGDLPTGLTLDETGVIHGTPSETGNDCFILQVEDSQSPVKDALQKRFCIEISETN